MIRKLRHKFVAIMMALVSVVLLSFCAALLISTWHQQVQATQAALRRTMDMPAGTMFKPEIVRQSGQAGQTGAAGTASPPPRPAGSAADSASDGIADSAADGIADSASGSASSGAAAAAGGGTREPAAMNAGGEFRTTFWAIVDGAGAVTNSNVESVDITADTLAALTAEVLAGGRASGAIADPDLRYLTKTVPEGTKIVFADRTAETSALQTLGLRLAAVASAALAALFAISVFLARMAVRPVEQAWEQQKQFVADASHELKTPLTVIMADASILQGHPQETVAAQRKWLDGIQDEGARMKKLIDDLLFLAKSDAARAPVVFSRVDFSDLTMSSVLSFESVAFEKGVALDTNVAAGLAVQGDAGQLKQLVAILTDNACKYAAGEKKVEISLKAAGNSAVLRVQNTGPELSAEELRHLFERFYRADPSRARSAGGYGLGLAIAKAIAEQHRGAIRAESAAGLTAFTVSLPLAR